MTADFHPHPAEPPKNEAAEKTLNIRVDRKRKATTLVIAIVTFALLAGVIVAVGLNSRDSDASPVSGAVAEGIGSGSAEVATGDPAATATDCPNPDADPFVDWFCKQIQPAFKVNAADHARIDRLEAEGRGGVPLALWVIVSAIGLLTVYNTVEARRARGTKKG